MNNTDFEELLHEAKSAAGDSKYVRSCESWYRRFGCLSEAQVESLERLIEDAWDGALSDET